MEENHRADGVVVNGPLRASADTTTMVVMKNAKRMKLEKVTLPAMTSGGQRVEVEGYKGTDPDGNVTRCICGFVHDDGYMICCDRCSVWQHVLCVGVNPNDPPENYLCDKCDSRPLDSVRAMTLQRRKLEEMTDLASTNSDESADESGSVSPPDFSSKLCEAVVHDHLSSTRLAPFASSGGLPRAKQRVRKTSMPRPLQLQKARSWDSQSLPSVLDSTQLQTVNVLAETTDQGIVDVTYPSHNNTVITDPWDCQSILWCDKKKLIPGNTYTKEIQNIVEIVLQNKLTMDLSLKPPQTDAVECVQRMEAKRRSLVCLSSVNPNTFLHEYQGRFLSRSDFDNEYGSIPWQNSLCPYVLFLQLASLSLCVDARLNGNVSRYVRRSCTPNAKVRCFIQDNKLQVGIFSQRHITAGTEITIPFDFNYRECNVILECPCGLSSCPVMAANQVTTQRLETLPLLLGTSRVGSSLMAIVHNERETSAYDRQMMQHHLEQQIIQPGSPRKMNATGNHLRCAKRRRRRQSDGAILVKKDGEGDSDGLEFDGFEQEKKKNLTREERKLEAIMKAFEKMEKSEKKKRETSNTGKSSGGASPESEDKKPTGRGKKVGQMGKKKPGKKRRSFAGLSFESLSPDSSSNLTSAPPATPVDIISPFTPPLVTTPVHTVTPGSSVKLPRKKFIVNEWMNQDRMGTTSAFGGLSAGISASQSLVERTMEEVKENGTGPFSNLTMTSKGSTFHSDVLTNDIQSDHSMSNGITLNHKRKQDEWTNPQTSEKCDIPYPQHLTYTPQSDIMESNISSYSTPVRAVDPRKALLTSWSASTASQETTEQNKQCNMALFCKKKRWLQMAKQVALTPSVPSDCNSNVNNESNETAWTETDVNRALPDTTLPTTLPSRHASLGVTDSVSSVVVTSQSSNVVVTSRSSGDMELGTGGREQGGKEVKRKKMSLLEYRNRKRDSTLKEETKNTSNWHSESLNSSHSHEASAFEVMRMQAFHPVSNFEVTNDANTQGDEHQRIPQPHTPPQPPVIEPVTPEGDQSDSEEATTQSPSREANSQWDNPLRDKPHNQIDWSSSRTQQPILKPPQLPDLPPLPVTPPPPPPPEDTSDLPAVPHSWPVTQFQPGWTTHPLLTFPYPQQQQQQTVVQPPASHTTSWTSFPHTGRTNYLTDSTQYTLGISSSTTFPSNGPFYH